MRYFLNIYFIIVLAIKDSKRAEKFKEREFQIIVLEEIEILGKWGVILVKENEIPIVKRRAMHG
ncbi:hypothetical protein BFU36_13310 [Sulfolobus sp. A20]|uniref:hypothetical protein n=1 Tax=Sulfolobaceae TaxID=118883 RepID=UPI000845EF5C|nr:MULTISPECIES: hypothetical protein [unclassified Sulfolobus]TRM74533.1 hypothetical protein DJ532_12575 [Sulfolobus sp. A20-N-F8]TRM76537.1 hypothetical protein DJ523_00885 [Sulfolobus sp. E5]TRM84799.1 hypothetical protein DJ522_03345 [Sulfolobus sp. F3]TRM87592.1 hypothetical protein DJ529_07910 [Sulfolobus sp. C3]TRM89008.1 hypothetical protein DJ521_00755 [Sulfolobus sp. E3]TRM98241.1 hypothetical protein DJ530_11330 [Sulfolobus sp. E1]TRN03507.1 hypothetical protein DJ527_01790 [Sulf